MAVNKNAYTRYHVLDRCFSNPMKKYFMEDLVEACCTALQELDPCSNGVKRRQIEEDIKYLESEEGGCIPLERHRAGKRYYYRYNDPKFSISHQPLNQAELEQVKSAMQILSRFKGMPQFEWVNELTPKLEQTFLLEKNNDTIIGFDSNQYLKGIEHLGRLFHDILYKRPLSIQYKPYKSEAVITYLLHPYYLKQYNNRWFLFGLHDRFRKITNLALDRIMEVTEAECTFLPNTSCDFDEYFEDIIGVTRFDNGVLQTIKLSFDREIAPYILSKPLHGSQKVVQRQDDSLVITIEVIPNYELESLLLSFGEKVVILEPASFREKFLERLKTGVALYEGNSKLE